MLSSYWNPGSAPLRIGIFILKIQANILIFMNQRDKETAAHFGKTNISLNLIARISFLRMLNLANILLSVRESIGLKFSYKSSFYNKQNSKSFVITAINTLRIGIQ